MSENTTHLLSVKDLHTSFTTDHGEVQAVNGVSFNLDAGKVLGIVGESGSGKTTTAMRLKAYLENLGVKVCLLSMDNFFLPLAERPKDLTDWESPLCVNRQLLLGTIEKLSNGETVQVPWYDFPNNRTAATPPWRAAARPSSSPKASTCSIPCSSIPSATVPPAFTLRPERVSSRPATASSTPSRCAWRAA